MFLSAGGILSLFLWALRDAAREGNLVKVIDLVNDGVSVHAHQYLDRRSPLHEACRYGHLDVVKYLLESTDAAVTATEKYSLSTPLHEACIGGHLAVVDYLVSEGKADLYYQDGEKQTALHKACAGGHVDLCRYLIAHGEQGLPGTRMVDARDKNERTPLHEAAKGGHLDVVQFLVKEARARVHDQSITGDTAMHYACVGDHVPVVKFLLDCQARLDVANREGLTPVDTARLSNSAAILLCLDQWEPNIDTDIIDQQEVRIMLSEGTACRMPWSP
jgi:ankyrin repeat protein